MKKCGVMCCVLFLAVFIVMAAVNSAHSQEVIKLKYTCFFPPMHAMSVIADEWCKEVEKRTNGRVQVTLFPGGTLVPPPQTLDGVINGIADIGLHVINFTPGRLPLSEVIALPLGVKNALQGTKMLTAWYEKFKPKEYDSVKILFVQASGTCYFMSTKPLNSINDLKGMKLRSGADTAKITKAMGGVPVSIPNADSYDGLQRGVIQGALQPAESLKGWKYGDLIKGYLVNHGIGASTGALIIMNKNKWSSLPPDIQKIIEQINVEYSNKMAAYWDQADKDGLEYGISKGMKVVTVSKAEEEKTRQLMKPILDEYVANMKKQGLPGEESLKFCLDYLKKNP